jgi:5'-nucleotidase
LNKVTVLHTNDLHGRLNDARADILRKIRQDLEEPIVLDAGDALAAGNLYPSPFGEPILERMARVGYDAMCLGNREFHLLTRVLEWKLGNCRHKVLSANLRTRRGKPPPVHKIWRKTLTNGTRVCVFGLTLPMVTERMRIGSVANLVFDDPLRVGETMAKELRKECDFLIALTHLGLARDKELLERTPEIDLVVGGHSHTPLKEPLKVGRGYIVQAEPWARGAGIAFITVKDGKMTQIKDKLVSLT